MSQVCSCSHRESNAQSSCFAAYLIAIHKRRRWHAGVSLRVRVRDKLPRLPIAAALLAGRWPAGAMLSGEQLAELAEAIPTVCFLYFFHRQAHL